MDAPAKVATAELGDGAPQRHVGYVTTPELAASAIVRDLLGELRTMNGVAGPPAVEPCRRVLLRPARLAVFLPGTWARARRVLHLLD
ncbi:MAG: hypothetical protein HOW71_40870 [Nonomuraea sp.]|nr:hypothetical protein [Nonomuraea sp.]NUP68528.1 hypothetical protein [Nonomuraea sp.]